MHSTDTQIVDSQAADVVFAGEPASARSRESALARLQRQVARRVDRLRLLRDAAALVAETLGMETCAWAWAEGPECPFVVHTRATAHVDDDTADGPTQWTLTGEPTASIFDFAIAQARTVVTTDLPQERRFLDASLLEHRVHAAMVIPIVGADRVAGVVAALSTQPASFSAADQTFVEMIGSLLFAMLARYDAEDELTEERELRRALLESLDQIVVELNGDGKIITVNAATERSGKFSAEQLVDRSFASALIIPEEVGPLGERISTAAATGEEQDFCGHLLDAEGERRPVHWRFARVTADRGVRLLATANDLSETISLRQQLAASRSTEDLVKEHLEQARNEVKNLRLATAVERTQPFALLRDDQGGERRRRPRRLYPYVQRIAPIIAGRIPTWDDFFEVRCRDIAAGGFSFLMNGPPRQEQYVAAFGVAPALTYLAADVAHTTKLEIDGKRMYIVGCKYTGRIEL